jgi:hypothetical protein
MLDVWLMHRREAMLLDELGYSQKPLSYVRRQAVELLRDPMIEDLHAPGHDV